MANSTAFLGCSHQYSNIEENLKFFGQLLYLVPSFLLIGRMIYVMNWVERDEYDGPFWTIYTVDMGLSFINLFFDIFYYRLSLFVPQICEAFSFFLRANPLLIHITFPLWYYFHVGKMVSQSILSIERMTFNIFSTQEFKKIWKNCLTISLFLIFLFPFTLIWNILISDKYIQFYYGGFQPNYARRVNWFGTTAWQLSYMQISMLITLITNLITCFHHLKTRSPGELCLIWLIISIEYLIIGSIFCYFHMVSFGFSYQNLIFILVFFVWDGFNILNPLTMIIMNRTLRKHVFALESEEEDIEMPRRR